MYSTHLFPEKDNVFREGVEVSLISVTTMILASPSVFLGDIFRWALSTIHKRKGKGIVFFDARLTTSVL